MKINQIFSEGVETVEVGGNTVPVMINPSKRQMHNWLINSEYGILRGWTVGAKSIYLWDAALAPHQEISTKLSIPLTRGDQPFLVALSEDELNGNSDWESHYISNAGPYYIQHTRNFQTYISGAFLSLFGDLELMESAHNDTGTKIVKSKRKAIDLKIGKFKKENDALEKLFPIKDRHIQHAIWEYSRDSKNVGFGDGLKTKRRQQKLIEKLKQLHIGLNDRYHVYAALGEVNPNRLLKNGVLRLDDMVGASLNIEAAIEVENQRRGRENKREDHILHLALPKGYKGCYYIAPECFEPAQLEMIIFPGQKFRQVLKKTINLDGGGTRVIWSMVPMDNVTGHEGSVMLDEGDVFVPATDQNISLAKKFILDKWKERAKERKLETPIDLSSSCKFSALFVKMVFGGKITGNYDHVFVLLNGNIIDINDSASDVLKLANPYHIDNRFITSADFKESLSSCVPRVTAWVSEFRSKIKTQLTEFNMDHVAPASPNNMWIKPDGQVIHLDRDGGEFHEDIAQQYFKSEKGYATVAAINNGWIRIYIPRGFHNNMAIEFNLEKVSRRALRRAVNAVREEGISVDISYGIHRSEFKSFVNSKDAILALNGWVPSANLVTTEGVDNTVTLWHGGKDLESSYHEMRAHKGGKWEHGPGLYLTTSYQTASNKYGKGGRSVYKVTVALGKNLSDVGVSKEVVIDFITKLVIGSKRKEFLELVNKNRGWKHIPEGQYPIEVLMNLSINLDAVKSSNTGKLRQFLVNHGVDQAIVKNFGGSGETVVVVINPKIIKRVEVVRAKDVKVDDYHLPMETLTEINLIPDFDDDLNTERKRNTWSENLSKAHRVGDIDELEVWVKPWPENECDEYFLVDAFGNPVGKAMLAQIRYSKEFHRISHIWFDPAIRNKGYGLKFYEYLLNNGIKIVSDTDQTRGSQRVWAALAKRGYVYSYGFDGTVGGKVSDTSSFYGGYAAGLLVAIKG